MTFQQQYEQQKKELKANITKAVDQWFVQACQNPALPQFIFYKPHTMQVCIAAQAPDSGWEKSTETRISNAITKPQAWQITFDALQQCEVYPSESSTSNAD